MYLNLIWCLVVEISFKFVCANEKLDGFSGMFLIYHLFHCIIDLVPEFGSLEHQGILVVGKFTMAQ